MSDQSNLQYAIIIPFPLRISIITFTVLVHAPFTSLEASTCVTLGFQYLDMDYSIRHWGKAMKCEDKFFLSKVGMIYPHRMGFLGCLVVRRDAYY